MAVTENVQGFSERIRALIDKSENSDPAVLAQELLKEMTWDERAEAFGVFAPIIVSRFLTLERIKPSSPPNLSKNSGKPTKTTADICREWWQAELRGRYVGLDGWKFLGEFTIADFLFASEQRTARAKSLLAHAQWLKKCAAMMTEVGVNRFDELAPPILTSLLSARGS